jgi:hypothetical protein
MWTLWLSLAQNWSARAVAANGFEGGTAADPTRAVEAVKFSPNYATDKIILAVTEPDNDAAAVAAGLNNVLLQVMWYESKKWNDDITGFTGYTLANLAIHALAAGVTLDSGSIAIPETYIGTDVGERVAFVGLADSAGGGGSWRYTDYYLKDIDTWTGAEEGPIHSLDYSSEKLLAGDYNQNQVYRCLSPLASTPKYERLNSFKQPGGVNLTIARWAGDNVIAGTSGDESAIAVSTDDGYSFNDVSLIDTILTTMSDAAVSADGSQLYLATYDAAVAGNNDVSIWIKASSWTRVLSIKNQATATAAHLIRLAPEDAAAVWVAQPGTQKVYVSKDSGKVLWKDASCYKVTTVQDMAVDSADVVYVIDTAGCSKTTNAGSSWGTKKHLDGVVGNMIALAPNGDVLVGGQHGYVAYSQDGGSTFTKIIKQIGDTDGNVQVVADSNYGENNTIYATVFGQDNIYRGSASESTSWSNKGPTTAAGMNFYGLAASGGLVYGLASDGVTTELWRALEPTAAEAALCLWSNVNTTAECQATPQALKLSSGPKLWAIATVAGAQVAGKQLYSVTDPIATTAPEMNNPVNNALIAVNQATGRAFNVTFAVQRQSTKVTNVQLQIATDADFTGIICDTGNQNMQDRETISMVIGPNGTTAVVEFMPGESYYWRVRASLPMISTWSEGQKFVIDKGVPPAPSSPVEIKIPPTPAPTPVPEIKVEVPPPTQVNIPPSPTPPAPVEAVPAYMLWIIIVIGAVLVVALIILIVRTRRAV